VRAAGQGTGPLPSPVPSADAGSRDSSIPLRFTLLIAAFLSTPAGSANLRLTLPIPCGSNDSCSIQNYVDLEAGPGLRDFGCGVLTYDGHRGTDFQLPDLRADEGGRASRGRRPGSGAHRP